jgi:hypothetical protein
MLTTVDLLRTCREGTREGFALKQICTVILLTVLVLGVFRCAVPTVPAEPAEYVKVSLNGGSEGTLEILCSMSITEIPLTLVRATDAGATQMNPTDYWTVQMADFEDGLSGQIMHTVSADAYFFCQNPIYTAIPASHALRYSFTGTMTQYQLVSGSLVTVATDIPLTGEFKILD